MSTETFTADNLVTSTVHLITDDAYPIAANTVITRGMVLKLVGGELTPCLTAEAPFTIALRNVPSSVTTTKTDYLVQGSVLESEVIYNTGSADEFRDALRSLNIFTVRG